MTVIAVATTLVVAVIVTTMVPASAADPSRRRHHRYNHDRDSRDHDASIGAYREDRACPPYEPADYKPRLLGQPLCYAARPYGLSQHLYDHSSLLRDY